jgi:hypothetical protein
VSQCLFRSGPPEVLLHILSSCASSRDALALASVCRHSRKVWRTNTAAVLWPLWLGEIPAFDVALIAVSGIVIFVLAYTDC